MPGVRRTLLPVIALALSLTLGQHHVALAHQTGGRYIVTYKKSAVPSARVGAETDARERVLGFDADARFRHAVKGFAAELSSADVRALEADPEVALVSPDRDVHAFGTAPLASGETVPTGVRRIGAATDGQARTPSAAAVAVIDTGVDLDHPDLDVADGKNCVGTGPADDDNGHGTHVAGTIAARNTGAGVIGVAPGTKVYAVKVLDATGAGNYSDIICGIDWVTAHAAALRIRVANMSLGGLGSYSTCTDEPLHQAVCNSTSAGVLYAVAAGNSGWDWGASPPDLPAWFPEVLTVTAMSDSDGRPGGQGGSPSCRPVESDDRRASFSNYSTAAADNAHAIAAPGVCIRSAAPGGGYATMSGTSMAAPHVAGAAAACIGDSADPGPCAGLSPAQIIQRMRTDAAASATSANGFAGDPLQPQGSRWYGYLTGLGLGSGAISADPAPAASPPTAAPAPRRAACTVRLKVRRYRHVRWRHRGGKRKRVAWVHRHVRVVRVCK